MYTTVRLHRTECGNISYRFTCMDPSRPWIVFLPGLTADHSLFNKQIPRFYPQYNSLTWDAPAHGLSRPFPLAFTLSGLSEYLHQILEAERIVKPVLAGQSLGGCIAQQYIRDHPDNVSAFIAIDSPPLSSQYYTAVELLALRHTKFLYEMIPWKLLLQWSVNGNAQTGYGRKLMRRMIEPYGKSEFCALTAYGFRILSDAAANAPSDPLPVPTLLLCGEKDTAGSVRRYNKAWAAAEQLPLVQVPDAGHCANADAPDFVNEEIDKFLQANHIE